jgi:hypothetical protein
MNSSEGLRGFVTFMILLAILGTGMAGFRYISSPTNTTSEADTPKTEPLNVTVNNITDSSAEITWTTIESSTTNVIYSKNLNAECLSNAEVTIDCQYTDLNESQMSHIAHLTALEPETTYFFRVLSNGVIYPTDANHTFRTTEKVAEVSEPVQGQQATPTTSTEEFDGFGEVNTGQPTTNKVLGVSDENVPEPVDPLGDIDGMMQDEFKEAMTYNDLRYDFNSDGEVTTKDWPLFLQNIMNYEQ